MGVRCEKCGHENDAKFLFCGMCGERLPSAQWHEKEDTDEAAKAPLSGMLSPTGELDADRAAYLLHDDDEEERPRHAGRLYLSLVFLTISIVLLAIHWRQYAHSWLSAYVARSAATNPGEPSSESGEEQPPVDAAPVSPAPAHATSKTVPKSVEPSTDVPQPATASVPVTTSRLPADLPAQVAANTTPASSGSAGADTAAPPAEPSRNMPHARPPPDLSPAAKGERYLYGNGVPQDCALARKNLALAAERKNARALSLMGTMYATGHCEPRDLPTAYGWFAQALRVDPGNHGVADNLSLIWKQMTPSEKQLALKK
jgi:hypothetical protein